MINKVNYKDLLIRILIVKVSIDSIEVGLGHEIVVRTVIYGIDGWIVA